MSAIAPKRTCLVAPHMSAFGGKADMRFCACLLLQSLLGVKRTCLVAPHMSAFDPKRTSVHARPLPVYWYGLIRCPVLSRGGRQMRRREFITLVGGAAAMWPLSPNAHQKLRRIGILFVLSASDPENQARLAAVIQSLLGRGRAARDKILRHVPYGDDNPHTIRMLAQELVRSAPAAIFVSRSSATRERHLAPAAIPILFANAAEPVAARIIKS